MGYYLQGVPTATVITEQFTSDVVWTAQESRRGLYKRHASFVYLHSDINTRA
jgi:hypothetical protein